MTLNPLHHSPTPIDQAVENEKIKELAITFGFPKDFDLILDSCGAIDVLKQVRNSENRQRHTRQAKPCLGALNTRALAFLDALTDLDRPARDALMATEPTATPGFIERLLLDTEQIQDIAEAALSSLDADGVGRPGEPKIKTALMILYPIYCEQFHDNHAFKSSPSAADGYEGKFFGFVCQLFDLLGIVRSHSAIGKQIQLAIQIIKGVEAQENTEE
jgi:hypothetical protein